MNVELLDNKDGTFSFMAHAFSLGGFRKIELARFEADEPLAYLLLEAFDLGRKFSG